VNADPKVDLVLHVGDIHSGKEYCTNSYDESIYDLWTQYKDPLVYTPGDNGGPTVTSPEKEETSRMRAAITWTTPTAIRWPTSR
jgi:hypothetical protein